MGAIFSCRQSQMEETVNFVCKINFRRRTWFRSETVVLEINVIISVPRSSLIKIQIRRIIWQVSNIFGERYWIFGLATQAIAKKKSH